MIAGLVNHGMAETEAKIKAKLTIESIINALKEGILQFENAPYVKIKTDFNIYRPRKTGEFRISRFDWNYWRPFVTDANN